MYIDKEKSNINPKNIPYYWLANQGVGGRTDENDGKSKGLEMGKEMKGEKKWKKENLGKI